MFSPAARRHRVAVPLALATLVLAGCSPAAAPHPEPSSTPSAVAKVDVSPDLRALENEFEARVGVSAIDTGSGAVLDYRADERFGYASTFKVFVAAHLLREVAPADRDERVYFTDEDVAAGGYSPVTSEHVADGLTLEELAEAAVRKTDNTATNLILHRLGGPAALDLALTDLGDDVTEVVDDEPELNDIDPGSTANTTTARAFTTSLGAVLEGALDDADRDLLVDWMSDNATGDPLIRAGAPDGWTVADKSGGADGIRNDIAIVTPPGRDPILITVLTTKLDPEADYDDALVADVAAVVLGAFE